MTQSPPVTDATTLSDDEIISSIGAYEYGWHDNDDYSKDVPLGINESVVRYISEVKDEPQWMRERRLKALELFERKPMPRGVRICRTLISMLLSTTCARRIVR